MSGNMYALILEGIYTMAGLNRHDYTRSIKLIHSYEAIGDAEDVTKGLKGAAHVRRVRDALPHAVPFGVIFGEGGVDVELPVADVVTEG